MKLCKKCNSIKNENYFHKRAMSIDSLSAICKECQSAYDKKRNNNESRILARKRYSASYDGKESSKKAKIKYALNNKEKCNSAKKKYREANREKIREKGRERYRLNKDYYKKSSINYKKKYPNKYKAHNVINNAIRDGKVRRENCEICKDKAHAHHDDYGKPLEVRWLCPAHHHQWHAKNGEALNP